MLASAHYASRQEPPASQAFIEFNRPRIEFFAGRDVEQAGGPRIVMLGNSRLKYGTLMADDGAGDATLDERRVLRLVNNWAIFDDFAPMAEAILAARPDVIVLQVELLGRTRPDTGRMLINRNYLKWLIFGRGPWNPGGADQHDLQFASPCQGDQSEARLQNRLSRLTKWQDFDLASENGRAAQVFIQRAADLGIRVVLLAMPVTERMTQSLPSVAEGMGQRVAEFTEDPRVNLLQYPFSLSDDHFCDFVHLNARGRRVFTQWFARQLDRLQGTLAAM